MKIIPAIDLMNGEVVRLVKGDPKQKTVYSDNPVEIAKKWEDAGADMLHLVDLDATYLHLHPPIFLLSQLGYHCKQFFVLDHL
jgi:phosphoribosylformimino-5-aminoimidazole carboxamide ribotide isomerase